MKRILNLLSLILVALPLRAQEVEMADKMRAEGKIYVVVAIVIIILTGLITYVFTLDRKAGRLEKKLEDLLKK